MLHTKHGRHTNKFTIRTSVKRNCPLKKHNSMAPSLFLCDGLKFLDAHTESDLSSYFLLHLMSMVLKLEKENIHFIRIMLSNSQFKSAALFHTTPL